MLLNGKNINDDIDENDLLALIGEDENRTLDFKGHGYRYKDKADDKWKSDLWIDVTSFANAVGGWIICGMTDKEGKADELCGLGEIDPDAERRRLEQCIRSGIEPQITGIQVRPIDLPNTGKGKALIIYVPQSFAAPHRVKETRKFHIRRTNWNDEMNIGEIRASFNLSENYVERIKGFRKLRVDALSADEKHEDVPVSLESGALLVVHCVPLNFAEPGTLISFKNFEFASKAFDKNYLYRMLNNARFNLDGVNIPLIDNVETRRADAYFQIYRNGAVEYVRVIDKLEWPNPVKDALLISVPYIEYLSLFGLKYSFKMQANLGVEPPFVVMLSLLRTKGRKFDSGIYGNKETLVRNAFLFPDVIAYTYEQSHAEVLRPIFDVIWNASGFNGSPSYDQNGNWIGELTP